MFTGIVEERGQVRATTGHQIVVSCRTVPSGSQIGASIAVNGVCLTVVERADDALTFDLSPETLERSSLRHLDAGHPVNLERPATMATRLGGHLVQGHVDGVGEVAAVEPDPTGGAQVTVRIPAHLLRYVVQKGSITIDGVSLTVAALTADGVVLALIPHTLQVTTLGSARPGDAVNIEVDVLAKYVERLLGRSPA
ncbi:MAG: riboflavin synthase [Actinomycetota bacterium]